MTDIGCFEDVARETGEYDHVISDISKLLGKRAMPSIGMKQIAEMTT